METSNINKVGMEFQYNNYCTCSYNVECSGECWEWTTDDFAEITNTLFDNNETYWWKVSGIRLWDGNHYGYVHAKTPQDLLSGMGVNSLWTMRGKVFDDHIEYSLYHHDAPTGSSSKVEIITEQQREDWGLY